MIVKFFRKFRSLYPLQSVKKHCVDGAVRKGNIIVDLAVQLTMTRVIVVKRVETFCVVTSVPLLFIFSASKFFLLTFFTTHIFASLFHCIIIRIYQKREILRPRKKTDHQLQKSGGQAKILVAKVKKIGSQR